MIITTDEARVIFPDLDSWTDEKLCRKLKAIEQTVRSYTNNNFQDKAYRNTADIIGGIFVVKGSTAFESGDTVMVSYGKNKGVFTVDMVTIHSFTVLEDVVDESNIIVTKVVYPADVVDAAINMLNWEANNRDKVGIKSETLSRYSVTYFDQDASNQIMGYPISLLGPLKPYRKMRC